MRVLSIPLRNVSYNLTVKKKQQWWYYLTSFTYCNIISLTNKYNSNNRLDNIFLHKGAHLHLGYPLIGFMYLRRLTQISISIVLMYYYNCFSFQKLNDTTVPSKYESNVPIMLHVLPFFEEVG